MGAELFTRYDVAHALKLDKLKLDAVAAPLMKIIKLNELNKLYAAAHSKTGLDFIDAVLAELSIKIEISDEDLKNIPASGSFIALANHPYGGIDGLIMLKLFTMARPDFKLIANFVLTKVHNIEHMLIPVNPFENVAQYKYNVSGLKQTLDFVEKGYPIGIFPAGEVSALKANSTKVSDKEWHPVAGRLISKTKLPVVPVHFQGGNSNLFNLLGLINPALRTAKLPSELFNKKGTSIKVRIGRPIQHKELKELNDNAQLLRYLRAKTYALGSAVEVEKFFNGPIFQTPTVAEDIIPPVSQTLIEQEIEGLKAENILFSQQHMDVFVASANRIPHILKEIGRLRETTFREVGEGTNKSIDLDEFDLYYMHLFVWDTVEKRIVGSYRVGKGADIIEKYRKKGFYIHTLFKIRNEFVPVLRQSLELGRSFIRKEYQQKPLSLLILWKGLLFFLKNNKEYRYLIGPVSISNSFSTASQAVIVQYIRKFCFDEQLAAYVQPRKEFKPSKNLVDTDALLKLKNETSLHELDNIISDIEPMRYKVPVLLKKYIKQKGRIIAFNVDPLFNNSLDGFLVLDVNDVPDETIKMLEKES